MLSTMWTTSSPELVTRDSRASETRARVKITPREKRLHAARRRLAFLTFWVIFTRARVSLALLSMRKNGGLLVVCLPCYRVRFVLKNHSSVEIVKEP